MQRLLVSVRGKNEALAAARGGAHIVDVEYPASALGTPYPLNILAVKEAVKEAGYDSILVSTNIGEVQASRASACQAALGVATAGAGLVKFGLGELPLEAAAYLGQSLVRTVKHWHKKVRLYPAVFVDTDLQRFFRPLDEGVELVLQTYADGLLVDTFDKLVGKGLLDYCTTERVQTLVNGLHSEGKEAWVAGSITHAELPDLWATGADVVCVRGAACEAEAGTGRFGQVSSDLVRQLVDTIPSPWISSLQGTNKETRQANYGNTEIGRYWPASGRAFRRTFSAEQPLK